jgi:hypothetical protein
MRAVGWRDGRDEADSCLSSFMETPKNDGAVHTVTKLVTGQPINRGSIPDRGFSIVSTPPQQPTHTPVQLQPWSSLHETTAVCHAVNVATFHVKV